MTFSSRILDNMRSQLLRDNLVIRDLYFDLLVMHFVILFQRDTSVWLYSADCLMVRGIFFVDNCRSVSRSVSGDAIYDFDLQVVD